MTINQVLVTGAAGFIGSHVVRCLKERYPTAHIRAMHLPNDNLINLKGLDVELFTGDLCSRDDMERAVEGCDAVFHLAAVFALWLPDMSLMDKVNVGGTRNLLEVCLAKGVKRVVHTSSYAMFAGQQTPCTEESPFRLHHSHYSKTKYESHKLAEEFSRKGLDVVIACPTAPIGPGDYGPTPTGRIIIDSTRVPINVVMKAGSNYVDVRDCAMGHVLAYEKGKTGESYILGGNNHSTAELVQNLEKVTGLKRFSITVSPQALIPIGWIAVQVSNFITRRAPLLTPSDLKTLGMGLWADNSKATRELGLPNRPLEESVRDALIWFGENGYLNDRLYRKIQPVLTKELSGQSR